MTALLLTALDVTAPKLEYRLLAPLLIVLLAACVGVILEAALQRHHRRDAQVLVAGFSLLGALVATGNTWYRGMRQVVAMGTLTIDGPALAIWSGLLIFGLGSLVLFAERHVTNNDSGFAPMAAAVPGSPLERAAQMAKVEHTEVYPLLMFALFGMMMFSASNDLVTMFVALEIFSLPLYLLSGLARRRRLLSQEAALKYFLLGALSSALFLYGTALLYGYSGSFRLSDIAAAVGGSPQSRTLLLAGMLLVSSGLLFKVGAVPFHNWTPDVYMGAPTPVTAFMAICTKTAAIGALLRVLYVALGGARWDWQPVIATVAVATMIVGAVIGVPQTDIKRLLAYSSIAHAGFLLMAVVGATTAQDGLAVGQIGSISAIEFYLAAYGLATIGAFAILLMVRKSGGEANSLVSWRGLGRRSPVLGVLMTLFLLSFAGIPLTAGFVGKLVVFVAAWRGGYGWLVVVAVICSLIAAFYYLRLVMLMWFSDQTDEQVEVLRPGILTSVLLGVCALGTVALGLMPGPLLTLLRGAAAFLR